MLKHVNITRQPVLFTSKHLVGKYVLTYFFDNNCVISIRSGSKQLFAGGADEEAIFIDALLGVPIGAGEQEDTVA